MTTSDPFYARLADRYEERIRQLVPRYDDMLEAVLHLLRAESPGHVVELGAGGGGLAARILECLPAARLTAIDVSAEMVARSSAALAVFGERARVVRADARQFSPAGPVDAVVSTLVLHNLEPGDRREVVARAASWLAPGGLFAWGEFLRKEDPGMQAETVAYRERFTAATDCPPDLAAWNYRKEAEEDHPPTAAEVLGSRSLGFAAADLVWAHDAFAVFAFRR